MAIQTRKAIRQRLHARIRKKVSGTTSRPRLAVNFSGQHIYVQVIDDTVGKTLVGVSTTEKALADSKLRPNVAGAEQVGKLVAERALAKDITSVVFDRGGFTFHGKVKALADAARSGGLQF
ncbi:50S ribosomal protein L18 [Verrucomicrobia bacterium LW23]|nr:50S ribosomal protein L18 [Verrucomicrobia bacterium LW23]